MSEPGTRPQTGTMAPHPTLAQYYGQAANRPGFLQNLFDSTAPSYDRLERLVGLGSGPWYRKEALERAGLGPGMRVLDVAIGTGLVAREAIRLVGDPRLVVGLDPSAGMLAQARTNLALPGVLAFGERQPLKNDSFDFLSMGYGLRHLSDLVVTFKEFHRVLKPGGRVCIMELTPPSNFLARAGLRIYLKGIVPVVARLVTGKRDGRVLMAYFWDTVQACVPPESILAALDTAGFAMVRRTLSIGMFSEYTAVKPGPGVSSSPAPEDLTTSGDFAVRVFPVYQAPRAS
jgi:demethylmenaquinone methyltransferase / 2-methoxy-6-polyprenyl-1,4-benzoquinol methylase